jgi:hypothetical protein
VLPSFKGVESPLPYRGEIRRRLLFSLYGLGTNAGLKRLTDGRNGLPTVFVLPVPLVAEHLEMARDILSDFVQCEFPGEDLPRLCFYTPTTVH